MTEFASNVATSTLIELSILMTNYEFESRMNFDSTSVDETAKERILNKKVFVIIEKMKNIWKFIKKRLINAQESQKKYANRKRIVSFNYVVEDIVWLFIKNIKIERSFRKLNHKWIDFYKIKKNVKKTLVSEIFQRQ